MKIKKTDFLFWSSIVVFGVAFLNHLLTFLAYDWYAGMDSYSYDVCGLQLVSGHVFDAFPVIYRPPLVPVLKNILYLLCEGHPYVLSILLHGLGIASVMLFFRLASRLYPLAGLIAGLLMAANLQISLFFHSISAMTFFIPLLLLALERFFAWITQPRRRSLVGLVCATFACTITQPEAIILIPVFFLFGWIAHKKTRQAFLFLIATAGLYSLVCYGYYAHFGYWGVTYKTGWSLFNRIARGRDRQFDIANGPSSRKIYDYMRQWIPANVSTDELDFQDLLRFTERESQQQEYLAKLGLKLSINERIMYTFNMAQRDLGFLGADRLFRKAAIETIVAHPYAFITSTGARVLGNLEVYHPQGLSQPEYYLQKARFCYTQQRTDMNTSRPQAYLPLSFWRPPPYTVPSPFGWERRTIMARFKKMCGLSAEMPPTPESFQMVPNFIIRDGVLHKRNCGDCVMTERRWNCPDLDVYFFLLYWGPRWQSKSALQLLKVWDTFLLPDDKMPVYLYWVLWVAFFAGICLSRKREVIVCLSAFLCIILFEATVQAIFNDNLGGRFVLIPRILLWLGAFCGMGAFIERLRPGHEHAITGM